MTEIIIKTILLSILPIAELRGGIPYAVGHDISIVPAFIICVLSNILVVPITFLFLETLHKQFYKIAVYRKLFDRFVVRTRKKAEKNVAKYGYWGIMLFVAIPLPITGAYTGTMAAWLLELNRKKSFFYLALGVVIAGIIVSVVTLTGVELFKIFIKQ
ncbi:MAG: small multi-drug export protein [Candidatus Zixiibacteriota bacterium]